VVLFSCETRATVDHGWMVHVNLGSIWPRWVKEKSAQAFIVFHYHCVGPVGLELASGPFLV
jgi:hypothetical protein